MLFPAEIMEMQTLKNNHNPHPSPLLSNIVKPKSSIILLEMAVKNSNSDRSKWCVWRRGTMSASHAIVPRFEPRLERTDRASMFRFSPAHRVHNQDLCARKKNPLLVEVEVASRAKFDKNGHTPTRSEGRGVALGANYSLYIKYRPQLFIATCQ